MFSASVLDVLAMRCEARTGGAYVRKKNLTKKKHGTLNINDETERKKNDVVIY